MFSLSSSFETLPLSSLQFGTAEWPLFAMRCTNLTSVPLLLNTLLLIACVEYMCAGVERVLENLTQVKVLSL